VVGRALLRAVCGNDPARFGRMDCRFSAPVFPGETIRTEIWPDATGAAFRGRDFELIRAGLDATWELDFFGRVRSSVKAARATSDVFQADLDALLLTLTSWVSSSCCCCVISSVFKDCSNNFI
jgi:hypothetical protein